MFRTATPGREHTARSFTASMQDWSDTSDNWFDGSTASVDRRISRCAKLLHLAQSEAARPGTDISSYLASIQELSADHTALAALREDLLTGGSDREAGVSPPGRTAAKAAMKRLGAAERRWVDLEAPRFLQANIDAAHAREELGIRATNHAEMHSRNRDVIAAFVDKVLSLGQAAPKPRVASAPTHVADFPDQMMFLA